MEKIALIFSSSHGKHYCNAAWHKTTQQGLHLITLEKWNIICCLGIFCYEETVPNTASIKFANLISWLRYSSCILQSQFVIHHFPHDKELGLGFNFAYVTQLYEIILLCNSLKGCEMVSQRISPIKLGVREWQMCVTKKLKKEPKLKNTGNCNDS